MQDKIKVAVNGYGVIGKRVALLVTDGFEQVELTEPKKALEAAGARAVRSYAASVVRATSCSACSWHRRSRCSGPWASVARNALVSSLPAS